MEHYKDLIQARETIKKKFKSLRRGELDANELLEKKFKPIVNPLKEIVKSNKQRELHEALETNISKTEDNDSAEKKEDQLEFGEISNPSSPETRDNEEVSNETDKVKVMTTSPTTLDTYVSTNFPEEVAVYFQQMIGSNRNEFDHKYGVYHDEQGNQWMIGDKPINFTEKSIVINNKPLFPSTPGLLELLFKKEPNKYTPDDLENYKKILDLSNAHKQSYKPDGTVDRNTSKKYRLVIKELFPTKLTKKSKRGAGIFLPVSKTRDRTFIYWDDPNELVNRLELLLSSKTAGHTGLDREILSIEEELREAGFIL